MSFQESQKESAKENGGAPYVELDDVTRMKAEAKYFSYYELFGDPDPEAQGSASFS